MSKTPRFDAILVRALAAELERRLGGARLHSGRFDAGSRSVRLASGRGTLVWDLRPAGSGPRLLPPGREPGNLPITAGSRIGGILARADERVLEIAIDAEDADAHDGVRRIVLELFGPHSNAYALDRDGVVLTPLRERGAGRPSLRGAAWQPPPPSTRAGVDSTPDVELFRDVLRHADAEARRRALLDRVAWTSPLNVAAIDGDGCARDAESAFRVWLALRDGTAAPVILDPDGAAQPYPVALPGASARPVDTLLEAFDVMRGTDRELANEDTLAALDGRQDTVRRRIERLRAQLDGASADAEQARRQAGLLLSQPHAVRKGRPEVELDDFAGGRERIALDPALDAAGNAERLYDLARRRERAARRIPAMLRSAEAEAARLEALAAAIRNGEPPPGSLAPVLKRAAAAKPGAKPTLPYRRYRSRSGLEIRVGRSARANDELTLRHCRPDDIWMHARDVGGAHVVLVWGRREQNPAEADLRDAAALAALHSRARTSRTVPVDWTRKKYVRKPRKAPPGTVVLERGKTLFVEPDPAIEERLRDPDDQA